MEEGYAEKGATEMKPSWNHLDITFFWISTNIREEPEIVRITNRHAVFAVDGNSNGSKAWLF